MNENDLIPKGNNWLDGFVGGCKISAKVYKEPSQYGIDGGRISKLEIIDKDNNTLVNYDRGWDIKPSKEFEIIYQNVVEALEKYYSQEKINGYVDFKLYSPLYCVVDTGDFEYEHMDELLKINMSDLKYYYEQINEAVQNANNKHLNNRGLAEYIDDENLQAKVYSMKPPVEVINGELYGIMECKLIEYLNPDELKGLKKECLGQFSDGYGESFEQRPIKTEDGELFVSFWNAEESFYIDTLDEHESRLDIGLEMKDITLC